jgi:hypothetical protein
MLFAVLTMYFGKLTLYFAKLLDSGPIKGRGVLFSDTFCRSPSILWGRVKIPNLGVKLRSLDVGGFPATASAVVCQHPVNLVN